MSDKKAVEKKPKKEKHIFATGKRKVAVARATAKKGTGRVLINKVPLEIFQPEIVRDIISEPVVLAGKTALQYDVNVSVKGGGIMGQAEAVRQALAKAFVEADKKLKPEFLKYDRTLLVADTRRNEPHKPSRSSAGPRRHKQRSKR